MDVSPRRPDRVAGEYLVGFRPDATPQQRAAALQSLAPQSVEDLPSINGALVHVDPNRTIDRGTLLPGVAGVVTWVQPNYLHDLRDDAPAVPVNDPSFPEQYPLQNTGQTGGTPGADMKIPDAWKISTGKGVVVALVDTNIDINHPDLAANIWTNPGEISNNDMDDDHNGYVDDVHGWNFLADSNDPTIGGGSHGTHTAGIIGAVAGNGIGIAGVAPGVKIMPLPILGRATTAGAVKAFAYAARNGAQIISNSWGNNTYEPALAAAVKTATDAGLMVVVAAGNESWDTGINGSYPDNYAGSVSVAASDHNDAKASYSNRGTITIDVAAPGDRVLSTLPGGSWGQKSGTSMAAPAYAGVAALVKSRYPNLTMKQVEDRIFRSAQRDGSAAKWDGLVASGGRVDAAAALMPIGTPGAPAPADQARAGSSIPLRWGSDITDGQRFEVQVSTNADARSTVAESFDGGSAVRRFTSSGDAGEWKIAPGVGADGSGGFVSPALGITKQSRLELTEVLTEPTTVSFWYRGGRGAELSFFVDRNLQFQPTQSDKWQQFTATIPAGEHTFSWLAGGRGGSGVAAIDNLRIGRVSDAAWKTVAVTEPGVTQAAWTPDAATSAAQVRVRASNGRWAGDWVAGPQFSVSG